MGCWWFIRKTPTHGFDCVWVRSILAAVSIAVRGVMVLNLLVSGRLTWSRLVLHSSLADLAAPRAATLAHQYAVQLSYWVVNHLVVLWLLVGPSAGGLPRWCISHEALLGVAVLGI